MASKTIFCFAVFLVVAAAAVAEEKSDAAPKAVVENEQRVKKSAVVPVPAAGSGEQFLVNQYLQITRQ
ncbi:Hypothetical protein CINCED_3A025778 [Cinara cedri]|uniref:Uncharacterized protein n=1 Tax=Cinara cedri TaxID=506608 RepID=A0A5E4N9N0_9HEMI|nr:Hypothetical protein CINCED_3A025778 [Cinara cedri]